MKQTLLIGIPTYQRHNSLIRLLESLSSLEVPEGLKISTVIADNEGVQSNLSARLDQIETRFEIKIIAVCERGISQTRNALLDYAFEQANADYLAMIDDDEVVSPNWIKELIIVAKDCDADVVGGLKKPSFEIKPERWMPENDVYFFAPTKQTGICARLVSTDNLMLTKKSFQRLGKPKFDASFGLTGGGDTEFLHRLKLAGAKFAFSREALSYEIIPQQRMSKRWAQQRSFRIGIGIARINQLHSTNLFSSALAVVKLLAILLAASALSILFLFNQRSRMKYQITAIRQIGKIAGYFGYRVYPYKNNA